MSALGLPDWLGKPLAVFLIDFLLAGDNALVIGLVCATLPPASRRWVLLIGTAGAIVSRVVLAGLAGYALTLPGLKLAGGVLLAVLALNLAARGPRGPAVALPFGARGDLLAAALVVTLVDVLMSLDNVLALAAVAGDSLPYLAIGLLLSVSILMFASALVASVLGRFPDLARLGAALLGWVAGQLAVADPLAHNAIASQAPALLLLVPALTAAYVFLIGGQTPRAAAPAMPPPPVPAAMRPAAPPPRAAPKPPAPVRAAPEPAESEANPAERRELLMFLGLFALAGVVLGALTLFGGNILR